MNDEKLAGLLQNLLLLENSLGIALISVGQFHGCDEGDINRLIVSREKLRTAILSEFAALRQQRDKLAEACKDLIIEVEDGVFPSAAHSTVWAVLNDDIKPLLASIEESE